LNNSPEQSNKFGHLSEERRTKRKSAKEKKKVLIEKGTKAKRGKKKTPFLSGLQKEN